MSNDKQQPKKKHYTGNNVQVIISPAQESDMQRQCGSANPFGNMTITLPKDGKKVVIGLKPGLNAYLRATYTPDGGVFVVEAIGAPNRNGAIRNLGPHEGRNKTAKRYRDADRQPHK